MSGHMRRATFIAALIGGAVAMPARSGARLASALGASSPGGLLADIPPIQPDIELPGVFLGGRPFLRLTTANGTRVLAWLDTDGSGFITEALVRRLNLAVTGMRAAVPIWREQCPPPGGDGLLPMLPAGQNDPLLAGIDIQLGGTWFAHRVWTIDYRNQKIVWHSTNGAAASDAVNPVPMKFTDDRRLYPLIPVIVEREVITMALDTAASVLRGPGDIVATSFVTHERFAKWRTAHPEWPVKGIADGVDSIDVPGVRVGGVQLGDVTFTTRPKDDVFEGETASGRLGSNACIGRELIIDYRRSVAAFD